MTVASFPQITSVEYAPVLKRELAARGMLMPTV